MVDIEYVVIILHNAAFSIRVSKIYIIILSIERV